MIRAVAFAVLATAGQADPLLSVAGTFDASTDYEIVLEQLQAVNADATSVSLFWDEMEKDGHYAPEFDWPAIANMVYPRRGLKISLMFSVVDTVTDRRPADLRRLRYDDPVVIERFKAFLTSVLQRMPDVTLTSIGIGNEVDGVLSGQEWDQYGTFFAAARDIAHGLRPGVPVGVTMTRSGFIGPDAVRARKLADLGDVWMLNYYPLAAGFHIEDPQTAAPALESILMMARGKQVYLTETGYPSGGCDASETGQLQFTRNVLEFAAAHAQQMPMVTLVFLHDLPPTDVDRYVSYYGVDSDCFAAYLATLGLRTFDGVDKPAFAWLRSR
jgi:hypothetical protein